MSKTFVFMFHFNQNIVPYIKIAHEACYKGLLNIIESHSDIQFMIHLSGTFINAIQWYHPEFITRVQELLKTNRIELVGSTYAQNVMYSTSTRDNIRQIKLHKHLLNEVFAISPSSFWNPERCWKQEIEEIIFQNGYESTWIEDHILSDSQIPENTNIIQLNSGLKIFRDNKDFQYYVNQAIFEDNFNELITFVKQSKQKILCYAEDAEAIGLWQFEGQLEFQLHSHPQIYWERLNRVLNTLKGLSHTEFKTFEQLSNVKPDFQMNRINSGQAQWMNKALKNKKAMYHEDGFKDWFDYDQRSIELSYFRKKYNSVSKYLDHFTTWLFNPPNENHQKIIDQLLLHLDYIWTIHQYEFGCIGLLQIKDMQWSGFQETLSLLKIIHIARVAPSSGIIIDDINFDGITEILYLWNQQLMVFSPFGGRLLYWFDLSTGYEIVGNECSSYYKEKIQHYMPTLEIDTPVINSQNIEFKKEKFELRRGALIDLIGYPTNQPSIHYQNNKKGTITSEYTLQEGLIDMRSRYRYNIKESQLIFSKKTDTIEFVKTIAYNSQEKCLMIDFEFINHSDQPIEFKFVSKNEWTIDYLNLLTWGKKYIKVEENHSNIKIQNTLSKVSINIITEEFDQFENDDSFLGIQTNPVVLIKLDPLESSQKQIKLSINHGI